MDSVSYGGFHTGRKRARAASADNIDIDLDHSDKKVRPTSGDSNGSWHPRDSVINTPTATSLGLLKPKYDSDDQSSMISEPGSPQDLEMSSGDEDMTENDIYRSQSPTFPSPTTPTHLPPASSPWRARTPTPMVPSPRHGSTLSPQPFSTAVKQHKRYRHPQEIVSSPPPTVRGHLEIPQSTEEDNAATPPSAAEDAGSQFSMLSVNDMDIEPGPDIPEISIARAPRTSSPRYAIDLDTDEDGDSKYGYAALNQPGMVRKQRQRSGALSAGGSPAPTSSTSDRGGGAGGRRGLSIGFRSDCEKCQLRVPGHMNHFLT